MIITVTMNPALDKTIELHSLKHGGLNRVQKMIKDAGGKGINVSKNIQALGGDSLAIGFFAGKQGDELADILNELGIKTDFIKVSGETRVNIKIAEEDGIVTELNEPGPEVTEEELELLSLKIASYAKEGVWFVLSGSVPQGVPKTIYKDIIYEIHNKGGKVLLDADGELLRYGLEAKPDIVKPNLNELKKLFQKEELSEEQIVEHAKTLLKKGVKMVALSLGDKGSMFFLKETIYKADALTVEVGSTVGAGDAMVAAIVYAMEKGMDMEKGIKLATATAAGAVQTTGTKPANLDEIQNLLKQVRISVGKL